MGYSYPANIRKLLRRIKEVKDAMNNLTKWPHINNYSRNKAYRSYVAYEVNLSYLRAKLRFYADAYFISKARTKRLKAQKQRLLSA